MGGMRRMDDSLDAGAGTGTGAAAGGAAEGLSAGEREDLLRLARTVVGEALRGDGAMVELEDLELKLTPALREKSGVFVVLRKGGEVLGYSGEARARRPLVNAVAAHALSAAFPEGGGGLEGRAAGLEGVDIEILVPGKGGEGWVAFHE